MMIGATSFFLALAPRLVGGFRQTIVPSQLSSRLRASTQVEDDHPEFRFEGLESVEEAMWRRVRTEVYGGPEYSAPRSLARFEEHCELRRSSSWKDDLVHLDGGRRTVFSEQQYPNLTAKAVWDVERDPRFQWIDELMNTGYYEAMREEVRVRTKSVPASKWSYANKTADETTGSYGMLHLHAGKPSLDAKCPRHLFPRVVRALRDVDAPIAPRYVSVARQKAGRSLRPHTDRIPWMLTCHIPLFGPQRSAYMLVDGERCNWTPGKPTVVDTTYQHSAHNDDNKDDMVLLHIDFFHPDLSLDEMQAMRILHRHLHIAKTQRAKELKPLINSLEAAFKAEDAKRDYY